MTLTERKLNRTDREVQDAKKEIQVAAIRARQLIAKLHPGDQEILLEELHVLLTEQTETTGKALQEAEDEAFRVSN